MFDVAQHNRAQIGFWHYAEIRTETVERAWSLDQFARAHGVDETAQPVFLWGRVEHRLTRIARKKTRAGNRMGETNEIGRCRAKAARGANVRRVKRGCVPKLAAPRISHSPARH